MADERTETSKKRPNERPILYNERMVAALLNTSVEEPNIGGSGMAPIDPSKPAKWITRRPYRPATRNLLHSRGGRLWVRESWSAAPAFDDIKPKHLATVQTSGVRYGREVAYLLNRRLRPSIHMPRWFSRLEQLVVDVRLEGLHNIKNRSLDVIGEGILSRNRGMGMAALGRLSEFRSVWDAIYGKGPYAWKHNPTVVRILARRVK